MRGRLDKGEAFYNLEQENLLGIPLFKSEERFYADINNAFLDNVISLDRRFSLIKQVREGEGEKSQYCVVGLTIVLPFHIKEPAEMGKETLINLLESSLMSLSDEVSYNLTFGPKAEGSGYMTESTLNTNFPEVIRV